MFERVYEILVYLIRLEGRNVVEIVLTDLYKVGVCKCGLGFLGGVLRLGFLIFYYFLNFTLLESRTDFSVVGKVEEAEITERVDP